MKKSIFIVIVFITLISCNDQKNELTLKKNKFDSHYIHSNEYVSDLLNSIYFDNRITLNNSKNKISYEEFIVLAEDYQNNKISKLNLDQEVRNLGFQSLESYEALNQDLYLLAKHLLENTDIEELSQEESSAIFLQYFNNAKYSNQRLNGACEDVQSDCIDSARAIAAVATVACYASALGVATISAGIGGYAYGAACGATVGYMLASSENLCNSNYSLCVEKPSN